MSDLPYPEKQRLEKQLFDLWGRRLDVVSYASKAGGRVLEVSLQCSSHHQWNALRYGHSEWKSFQCEICEAAASKRSDRKPPALTIIAESEPFRSEQVRI